MSALERDAICPYFKKEVKGAVRCEAGSVRPKDSQMRRELCYGFCAGQWWECQFKKSLDSYYERTAKETFN